MDFRITLDDTDGIVRISLFLFLFPRLFLDHKDPTSTIHAFVDIFPKRKHHVEDSSGRFSNRLSLRDNSDLYAQIAYARALMLTSEAAYIVLVERSVQKAFAQMVVFMSPAIQKEIWRRMKMWSWRGTTILCCILAQMYMQISNLLMPPLVLSPSTFQGEPVLVEQ